jgi:SAM-dependent methyltransferase
MTEHHTSSHWRFALEVVTPAVQRLLPNPGERLAVELDPSDDDLLTAARAFFGEALRATSDGGKIPLPDASADFIYSFNALWNAPDIATFESFIRETARVLRPGGVAMLWCGRITRLPFAVNPSHWLRGWDGPGPTAPGAAIRVRSSLVRRLAIRAGMQAVALSTPLHPDLSHRLLRAGPRSYITCWKPAG